MGGIGLPLKCVLICVYSRKPDGTYASAKKRFLILYSCDDLTTEEAEHSASLPTPGATAYPSNN